MTDGDGMEFRERVRKFRRFVLAVIRREPAGHISDLWGEFTGKLVLCGKPPNQYLMHRSDLDKGN